jgi:hypothetical protein
MLIKQKSMVVALTSGCIISAVLILTLIGFAAYTKIRDDKFKRHYEESLRKIRG